MKQYLALRAAERRQLCENAQVQLGLAASSIEKDLWVTWALRELFATPAWGNALTFKGGTSLSKGWRLIQRFSEDVDVVIDRDFLGFGDGEFNNKRIKKLKAECSLRIREVLLPLLHGRFQRSLEEKSEKWSLEMASKEDDPDEQTLLFAYPSEFAEAGRYSPPHVRIELGARSDTEPAESPRIAPLAADSFPDVFADDIFSVRTVSPRRTFWEKALLLHEEGFRPADMPIRQGLSRHYYDLWCLITRGVATDATVDFDLFEAVVSHRQKFFRLSWVDYATCRVGRLKIAPTQEREALWRRDYAAMREEMFFNDPPAFDAVMVTIRDFESALNDRGDSAVLLR